jgi:hypothetical protein
MGMAAAFTTFDDTSEGSRAGSLYHLELNFPHSLTLKLETVILEREIIHLRARLQVQRM